jgi:hypothetical protein
MRRSATPLSVFFGCEIRVMIILEYVPRGQRHVLAQSTIQLRAEKICRIEVALSFRFSSLLQSSDFG